MRFLYCIRWQGEDNEKGQAMTDEEERTYISGDRPSPCIMCGKFEDLRCGSCFDCSTFVGGMKIPGGHILWDTRNKNIIWSVNENFELMDDYE